MFGEGVFPKIWKKGVVRFLLKAKDKKRSDPKSYRPICLLSTLGKLLEKLMVLKLSSWKSLPYLYGGRQYGFVKGRGTVDAIRNVVKYVEESMDNYVAAVLFDVEGAFDGLWWPSLIKKLRLEECPYNLFKLLRNYLEDRSVSVISSDGSLEKKLIGDVHRARFWARSCGI